jgi:hypothetical protein
LRSALARKPARRAPASARATTAWHAGASLLMKRYAERGVFRGQIDESESRDVRAFKLRWHRNRQFLLLLDRRQRLARVADLLPGMPARSEMYREFKEFVASFQDGTRAPHRSVDPRKVLLATTSRGGSVSLSVRMRDNDFEYAMDKLLTLIHETFLTFLNGPYDMYRVEQLGADPDWGR